MTWVGPSALPTIVMLRLELDLSAFYRIPFIVLSSPIALPKHLSHKDTLLRWMDIDNTYHYALVVAAKATMSWIPTTIYMGQLKREMVPDGSIFRSKFSIFLRFWTVIHINSTHRAFT